MITDTGNERYYEFHCLSTDGKPINHGHTKGDSSYVYDEKYTKIANGSVLFCIDTAEAFMLKIVATTVGETTTYTDTWVAL